jgi:hypothetical protein
MANQQQDAMSKKWDYMSGLEKVEFVAKLFVALCTFGFVYPNILSD